MNRLVLFIVAAAVLVVLPMPAVAATWNWTGLSGVDATDWNDPDNWDTPALDLVIPGFGAYAGDNVKVKGGVTVDIGATSPNVGQLYTDNNDQLFKGTGVINATEIYVDDRSNNQNFETDLVVSGRIYVKSKASIPNFRGTVSADSLDIGNAQSIFHKAMTITNVADGLVGFYRSAGTGSHTIYVFNDVLNASKVSLVSATLGKLCIVKTGHADTLSGVTGAVTVNGGGELNLVVAQNTFPGGGIMMNADSMLTGDTGAATWGAGNNMDVAEDAIFATTGGSLPTAADLGLTVGVKDALIWKGVIDNGTYTVGDDGDSVWKGVAVGGFTTSLASKTLVAPAGAGDVEVKWLGRTYNKQTIKMDMISTDGTGVANIDVTGSMFSSWNGDSGNFFSGINRTTVDANRVTTINLNMLGGMTSQLVQLTHDFVTRDEQTYNLLGQGRAQFNPEEMYGHISVGENVMFNPIASIARRFLPASTDPNVKLTFAANSALLINNANMTSVLEDLEAGQLVVNGTPLVALNRGLDITDANQPILRGLTRTSHVVIAGGDNSQINAKSDFVVGDGMYLMSHSGRTNRPCDFVADATTPLAKIVAAGGVGTTLGIGSLGSGGSIGLVMPVDANGGTVLINSKADEKWMRKSSNEKNLLNGWVYFEGRFDNAAAVRLAKGTIQVENETIDDGSLVGGVLPIVVEDQAKLQFNSAVATLADTQVEIEQGGHMYVNNPLTVKNMILNSTYGSNDGLQLNDATDILTVTGTLSGDGAWGDSGKILIASSGTVAPGNSVGTLTGSNLDLADGSTLEVEFADPDSTAGVGWDLLFANVDFDTTDDDAGTINFSILGEELTRDVALDDEFIVVALENGTIDEPGTWNFIGGEGWTVDTAILTYENNYADVDDDGDMDDVLILSNITYVGQVTQTWDGWDPADWDSPHWDPGSVGPIADAAMVVDSGTVTVAATPGVVPESLAIAGGVTGGTVNIVPAATLSVTGEVSVGDGGSLNVDGTLSAGGFNVAAGGRLTLGDGSSIVSPAAAEAGGNVTITVGGTLSGGDGVSTLGDIYDPVAETGDLGLTNLTLAAGSTYEQTFTFDGLSSELNGGGFDMVEGNRVDVNGHLTLGDNVTIRLVDNGGIANNEDVVLFRAFDGIDISTYSIELPDDWGSGGLLVDLPNGLLILEGLITGAAGPLPGDANGNGVVDDADWVIFKAQFGGAPGGVNDDADFNNDGRVDLRDLAILDAAWGDGPPSAPDGSGNDVPEPATMSLLALGGLLVLRRRRRKAKTGSRVG